MSILFSINQYQTNHTGEGFGMNTPQSSLFVVSAPTGGGKTTLVVRVLAKFGSTLPITKAITYTTRPARPGEINGKDYFFLSKEDFLNKKANGFFLETTQYDDQWYGSPINLMDEIKNGKSYILVTDRPGAKTIKALIPKAILIWIGVPNLDVVIHRLKNRGTEQCEQLARRVNLAAHEIEDEQNHPLFKYHIINRDLNEAVAELAYIMTQELQGHAPS